MSKAYMIIIEVQPSTNSVIMEAWSFLKIDMVKIKTNIHREMTVIDGRRTDHNHKSLNDLLELVSNLVSNFVA